MDPDSDDPILCEVRIAIMAQADDILLVSFSAAGLQRKLNTLYVWCSKNFIVINMIKTVIMIFGPVPQPLPPFHLGSTTLNLTTHEKYVGVHIRTDTRNMFESHYKEKASTARYCAHRIMGLEDSTGRLTPKEYIQLYMARVDCHLIHGCEVSPDSEDIHVKELCEVQVNFLRQILNVHSHSMLAPLFTETGIMPLRVRRYLVMLVYLQYLLGPKVPEFARVCLKSSIELARRKKKSWFGDLCTAASKLPFECPPPEIDNATPKSIEAYAKSVEQLALQWLQREVDSSDKLYLLHGRREPQKDKPPTVITLYRRHYLTMVRTQKHREALTSVMLSTHQLAVERLRYVDHAHQPVPREARVCRFCLNTVETPEHALLDCTGSPAVQNLRTIFLGTLLQTVPTLQQKMIELNSTSFLQAIIYQRSTIVLVAKYVHDILEVFYSVPLHRP
ncbi:hypothetical protein DFH06DRAFT_1093769 [Mycena polygramma]|nr:hypothetical protein DFH06DRAFT_1093769 [Mycena polygramma]